jgi:protein-tyrosine phosphatase
MAEAFLRDRLERDLAAEAVVVGSAGFRSEGAPPTSHTVDVMRRRGLDVSAHRSRRVGAADVDGADLIIAAERDHVVRIATMAPEAFARTFTVLELADLAPGTASSDPEPIRRWISRLGADRGTAEYLRGHAGETADPTGRSRRRFESTASELQAACEVIADAIVRRIRVGGP